MELLAEVLEALLRQENLRQTLLPLQDPNTLEDAQQVLLRGLLVLPRSIVDPVHE